MSGNGEFLGDYKDSLDQLNNSLDQIERSVNQLYEGMGKFVSRKEMDSEAKFREIIKKYRDIHVHLFEKYQYLKEKLSRENCQILIYGKVSTGKSKIVNAILGQDIFQSASSHTTSCFVKIRKSSDQSHHIEHRNRKILCNQLDDFKNKIREMSTEFSNDKNKLETNELLTVYLNIPENKILTSTTEIIDCPGSANRESITKYIKEKALNANIFIFVLNGGITEDEQSFFQYQWEQSSKPIIFILVNKWDQAYNDGEDVAENSRNNITEGLMDFLMNRINLTADDPNNRIFFVSALDICRNRNIGTVNSINIDNYEGRSHEFENFEESLSQFIISFLEDKKKYEEDLIDLSNKITDFQFKPEFQRELNNEDSEKLETFLKEIQISLENEKEKISKMKEDSINEIKSFVDKCEKGIDRYKIESLQNEFDKLIDQNENPVLKLQIEIGSFIDEQIKNYKQLTDIYVEKKTLDFKEMMKTEIKLTTISDSKWEYFCNKFTSFFKFLRNHFIKSRKKNDEVILKENIDLIKTEMEKLENHINDTTNSLSKYQETEINDIIKQLKLKIKLYKEFSTNIGN